MLDDLFKRGGTYAEVNPANMDIGGARTQVSRADAAPWVVEVIGLQTLGLVDLARERIAGRTGLAAQALGACLAENGDIRDRIDELRDVVDEAEGEEPGLPVALYALANLLARSGRYKSARRVLVRLRKQSPAFFSGTVEAAQAALTTLLES